MSLASITIGSMEARPPFIRFEKRAIEKRDAEGLAMWVDTDYALVTPFGSKDTVEKVVSEWFARLKDEVRQQRFPQTWFDAYKASYEAWRNDQAPPVNGQDLKNWPAITPAQLKMLNQHHVLSIEDLAAANEELLQRLGMGARHLKQLAVDWLAARSDATPLVHQLGAMRVENQSLLAMVEELKTKMAVLEARLSQRVEAAPLPELPSLEDRLPTTKDNTDELILDGIEAELGKAGDEE